MTSYKTNFEKVKEFNIAFGISRSDQENPNVFYENPGLVKLRLSLIKEETNELEDAYNSCDFVEVIDALADIEYVIHGCADSFGINLDFYTVDMKFQREHLMKNDKKINILQFQTKMVGRETCKVSETLPYLLGKHSQLVNQLESAFLNKDFEKSKAVLANLYNSVTQMAELLGVDIDYVFDLVHQSNMSKLCSSLEEAEESQKKYENDQEKRYDSPKIRKSQLEGKWVVYNESSGKALKSHLYHQVTEDLKKYMYK